MTLSNHMAPTGGTERGSPLSSTARTTEGADRNGNDNESLLIMFEFGAPVYD